MKDEVVIIDSLASFIENYCPFQPSDAFVEEVSRALKTDLLLSRDEEDKAWSSFPGEEKATEVEMCAGLEDICECLRALGVVADGDRERLPQFRYTSIPNNRTATYIQGEAHKVDAVLSSVPDGTLVEHILTSDMAVIFEFKKERTWQRIHENRLQVIGGSTSVMNDDPRRDYTYGITIEADQMSVWYFSRSHSAKCLSFSVHKEWKSVIKILLSMIYATPEEVGFNPNIQRISGLSQDEPVSYIYRVEEMGKEPRFFWTQRTIVDYPSLCITGHAIRIWEVLQVVDFSKVVNRHHEAPKPLPAAKPQVLKDVWLEEGALTEREIQTQIFEDLKVVGSVLAANSAQKSPSTSSVGSEPPGNLPSVLETIPLSERVDVEGPDILECFTQFEEHASDAGKALRQCLLDGKYDKHFLHIDADAKSSTAKPICPSYFRPAEFFQGQPSAMKSPTVPHTDHTRASGSHHHVDRGKPEDGSVVRRSFKPKFRYFVVFREVCKPIHGVDNLAHAMSAIQDCLLGYALMFLVGWIHRDISSGNLSLYFDAEGRAIGLISDLEYSRRFDRVREMVRFDPKTGTPYFMALEIQTRTLIPPSGSDESSSDDEPPSDQLDNIPLPRARTVIPHPGHDVESFWWLILWILLAQVDHQLSYDYSTTIFRHQSDPSLQRIFVFTNPQVLKEELPRKLLPALWKKTRLIKAVTKARREIYRHHVQRVKQSFLTRASVVLAWSSVLDITRVLLKLTAENDHANLALRVIKEGMETKPAGRKRPAFEDAKPDTTQSTPKKAKT